MKQVKKVIASTFLITAACAPVTALAVPLTNNLNTITNTAGNTVNEVTNTAASTVDEVTTTNLMAPTSIKDYSTYSFTDMTKGSNYTPSSLIPTRYQSQTNINDAVTNATKNMTPMRLHLGANDKGLYGYGSVKVEPAGASGVQLWAKDAEGNWRDINADGWGPVAGFKLDANHDETLDVYVVADAAATYPVTLRLVETKDPTVIIAENTIDLNVVEN